MSRDNHWRGRSVNSLISFQVIVLLLASFRHKVSDAPQRKNAKYAERSRDRKQLFSVSGILEFLECQNRPFDLGRSERERERKRREETS